MQTVKLTLGRKANVSLDQIGSGGTVVADPERWLAKYDLVLAVGRSAIEAHVVRTPPVRAAFR